MSGVYEEDEEQVKAESLEDIAVIAIAGQSNGNGNWGSNLRELVHGMMPGRNTGGEPSRNGSDQGNGSADIHRDPHVHINSTTSLPPPPQQTHHHDNNVSASSSTLPPQQPHHPDNNLTASSSRNQPSVNPTVAGPTGSIITDTSTTTTEIPSPGQANANANASTETEIQAKAHALAEHIQATIEEMRGGGSRVGEGDGVGSSHEGGEEGVRGGAGDREIAGVMRQEEEMEEEEEEEDEQEEEEEEELPEIQDRNRSQSYAPENQDPADPDTSDSDSDYEMDIDDEDGTELMKAEVEAERITRSSARQRAVKEKEKEKEQAEKIVSVVEEPVKRVTRQSATVVKPGESSRVGGSTAAVAKASPGTFTAKDSPKAGDKRKRSVPPTRQRSRTATSATPISKQDKGKGRVIELVSDDSSSEDEEEKKRRRNNWRNWALLSQSPEPREFDEEPYVCLEPHCGKRFWQESGLAGHAISRESCGNCATNRLEYSSLANRRSSIRLVDQRWECPACGADLQSSKDNVLRHINRHRAKDEWLESYAMPHEKEEVKPARDAGGLSGSLAAGRWRCPICLGDLKKDKHNVQRHIRRHRERSEWPDDQPVPFLEEVSGVAAIIVDGNGNAAAQASTHAINENAVETGVSQIAVGSATVSAAGSVTPATSMVLVESATPHGPRTNGRGNPTSADETIPRQAGPATSLTALNTEAATSISASGLYIAPLGVNGGTSAVTVGDNVAWTPTSPANNGLTPTTRDWPSVEQSTVDNQSHVVECTTGAASSLPLVGGTKDRQSTMLNGASHGVAAQLTSTTVNRAASSVSTLR